MHLKKYVPVVCMINFEITFQFIHNEIHKKIQNCNLGSEISFTFKDVDGYIELCFDTVQCTKGWSVIPHEVPTKVSKYNNKLYFYNNIGQSEHYRFVWQLFSS